MSDTTTLGEDAFARLEAEPQVPGRERVATPATWVLLALLGIGASFIGGAWWGQRNPATAATTPAAAVGLGAGRTAAAGTPIATTVAAAATAPTATSGVVKLIDGRNVYITTPAGQTVKLVLAADAKVSVAAPGALTDLKTGVTIAFSGTTNADGTVSATSITSI